MQFDLFSVESVAICLWLFVCLWCVSSCTCKVSFSFKLGDFLYIYIYISSPFLFSGCFCLTFFCVCFCLVLFGSCCGRVCAALWFCLLRFDGRYLLLPLLFACSPLVNLGVIVYFNKSWTRGHVPRHAHKGDGGDGEIGEAMPHFTFLFVSQCKRYHQYVLEIVRRVSDAQLQIGFNVVFNWPITWLLRGYRMAVVWVPHVVWGHQSSSGCTPASIFFRMHARSLRMLVVLIEFDCRWVFDRCFFGANRNGHV